MFEFKPTWSCRSGRSGGTGCRPSRSGSEVSPDYETKNVRLRKVEVRWGLVLRQVALLTGTVKNLDTWESKKGLMFGKLHLELNEGISIRALVFPDYWKKLKTHLKNGMEITAVGKIDLMNDYVMLIFGLIIWGHPRPFQVYVF